MSVVVSEENKGFPGPMMVYALTLNVIIVLGGRYLSVCCVADVLM